MNAIRTRPGQYPSEIRLTEPAWNLAVDESMLMAAEAGESGEWLRVWESGTPFVVLGAGGRIVEEVQEPALDQQTVPVLRRCSGGGTVLQGPGCLNFAVVVDFRLRPEAQTVDGTTRLVLGQVAQALSRQGVEVTMEGTSDLAREGRKVSGNAQRRKKHHALFHGTLLLEGFDLGLMASVLKHPPRQPDWRQQRTHGAFVGCLNIDRDRFWSDLCEGWSAPVLSDGLAVPSVLLARATDFAREKYGHDSWNRSL